MKPAPFDYLPCASIEEATACLAYNGEDARVLAGGQSLIAMLNMRLLEPRIIVDISRIAALSALENTDTAITLGAAVTQATLQRFPQLEQNVPLLAQALPHVGHFQTRNKGTVCGSLAHADPSSELPLVASVLDAQITLASATGTRHMHARNFFVGLLQTTRNADELITSVSFPHARPGEGYAFNEASMRHGDFAVIAVAVKATTNGITIGIGGGPEKPEIRDLPALQGSALDDALNTLAWELSLQDDALAPSSYRRRLVRGLGRKTIEEARLCLN